jgi:hypothetical protein
MLGREVRMCKSLGCGNFFVLSRIDKECCSPTCSAKEATKKRYWETVKPMRQKAAQQKLVKKAKTVPKKG